MLKKRRFCLLSFIFGTSSGLVNRNPFPPKSTNTSSGNTLTFHGSCDAGNNTAFLIAAQKVQNNTWTHIKRQFAKGDLTSINPPANSKRFANLDRQILPNLDYRVWNFATGDTTTTRPYFKIINHPIFDHPDE